MSNPARSTARIPAVAKPATRLRIQRKCACGSKPEGRCDACEAERLRGVQPKLVIGGTDDVFEREADRVADHVMSGHGHPAAQPSPLRIQRVAETAAAGEVPPEVDRALAAPARALDEGTRGFFEQRFGYDLSRVRIHDDAQAAASAARISARAYTVGHDVVFAAGQYQPQSEGGRRLLAHELTHTLQQSGGHPRVQRTPCGHDGQPTNCRAELGVLKLRNAAGSVGQMISIDRWIADEGLPREFPGQWAAQVASPPNPLKAGEDRGFVDAARVDDSGPLVVEVAEIKARSAQGGGCVLATSEARAYVNVLGWLKPQVIALSAGLAKQGGVRVNGGCRTQKAADRQKLIAAGLDFNNEASMYAWCFINSLQERLGKTYTKPFTDLQVKLFAGEDPAKTYEMWPPMRIDCPKKGGKRLPGWTFLGYQVNKLGGISYGCRDLCSDNEEEEKRRTQELVKQDEDRRKKQTAPRQSVPIDMYVDNPDQPDIDEDQPPVNLPSGGVSATDAIVAGGAAVVTLAALHQAAKALQGKELEAARKTAARVLAEARAKGAIDVARKLNSQRLAKDFGKAAYDKTVTGVAEGVEKQALKDAGFLAKHGAKGARFLGRAAAVLGVILLAKDAVAAVSHISKGGTIDIGLTGMDASLEGSTDVKTKGAPGSQDVKGDVKLKDTQIDIETRGFPSVKGNVELDAEKVTIRGRAGDGDASINFTGKFRNTTITITRTGSVKGGKLTMDGGSDISDADIEIALPPGADLTKPRDPSTPLVIKGGKIKVTEVGGGGGGGAGASGTPAPGTPPPGTPAPPASTDKDAPGPGSGTGSGSKPPTQAPTAPGGTQPAGTSKPQDLGELVREVQSSPGLRTLYVGLLGKDDGVPVTPEMLARLIALKAPLERHPAIVQEILKGLKPAQIKDPIKDIIEPIEQRMQNADQKLAKARDKAIADAKAKAPAPGAKPGTVPPGSTQKPGTEKPADTGQKPGAGDKAQKPDPQPGPTGGAGGDIDLGSVRELSMLELAQSGQLERPSQGSKDKTPPPAMDYVFVWRLKIDQSELVYNIGVPLKFRNNLKAQGSEYWRAEYTCQPPTGVIVSTQGDMPIRFVDTGTTIIVQIVTVPAGKATP